MRTEVLIVGAGPTGLSLAAQFVRYGVDFVIIDQKDAVTELSKAVAVHARTLEIYDQLGLAHNAISRGAVVNHVAMLNEGRIRAEIDFGDIGGNLSPFPFVLTLEQSRNEHLLYEYLKARKQEVRWLTGLESLEQDEQHVRAVVKSVSGVAEEIEARYVVGCDGAGSKTRHLLDLSFAGDTDARLFYVADVEMTADINHDTLHLVFGADAFVLFFPMEGANHWRLVGNLPEFREAVNETFDYAEIERKIKALAGIPLDITNVKWFSTYKVHTRRAERFSKGRVFIAGDAAHIHTPAGGQGMNTGIQDAYNLAWKIAYVLRHNADAALLETYNEERIANAVRLLRTTDEAFEFGTGEEWYFRFFRERVLPTVAPFLLQFKTAKQFVFPLISQIGISYDEAVLSRNNPSESYKVKAGNRFPYFKLAGEDIYDYLAAPKSHLLVLPDGIADFSASVQTVRDKYSDFIDVKIIPLYPSLVEMFGSARTLSVFVRPDGHIGFVTSADPLEAVGLYVSENLQLKRQG
jgi:2-polyprenyl-6-methoxyphenol hydroxylase-like FAD-dependent oxidoreductase